ncbi:hypothetical protein BDN71DRAFT_1434001 [Pleurotus eryngii]|uniref:Uncharacterized protein n=1 Tax=Pleurotus eryngii TaxID=5323 RepID=A0A9P6DDI5_PLEER|nr:hypothetical protein BDN71DRAFT_1434001 [Pleurotus eryngii]
MNSFYNKIEAEAASSPQMYEMDLEAVERFGLTILKEDTDTISKLVQCNDAGEVEEATIAIQGIISRCLLPLFELKSNRYTPNAKLHPLLEFLGKYKSTNVSGVNEYTTITASAHFFTPAKQATGFSIVDMNPELDPHGVLGKVDRTKWMHTDDNKVEYYMFMPHDDDKR